MKLISAQIKNYSNVVNTKEFEIENVTCLAGRNVEGKTDTLRALTRLHPADPLDGNFFDLRQSNERLGDLNDRPENVLVTKWILMQEDISAMEKFLGRRCLTSEVVTIRKGYKNELQWDIPINFDFYRKDSPDEVSGNQYKLFRSESGAITNLVDSLKQKSHGASGDKLVVTDYKINRSTASNTGREILEKRLSRFLYFSVFDIIASDASLQELIKKRETDSYTTGERILLDWFALAGTSPEQILSSGDADTIAARMSQLAETLCRKINQYWSHYGDLVFDFSFIPVVPKEPGKHSVDQQIRIRVKSRRTGLKESIDESRSGFLWFFSFLVRYNKAVGCYGDNMVLVLDEPGLTESNRAQAALLTYFSRELTPKHQLIYSTHLSAMIDPTLF